MIAIDLPPKIAFPKPAIVRAAGDLHRHDRRAIEREFGVRLPEPKLAMLPGMMPVGWAGGGVGFSSLSHVASASSSTPDITIPVAAAEYDFAVLFDYGANGSGEPSNTIPSGWLSAVTGGDGSNARIAMRYKMLGPSDPGATVTGIDAETDDKLMLIFRPNVQLTTVTPTDMVAKMTSNNPSSQTINASGATTPLIVVGCGMKYADTMSFSTESPSFDATETSADQDALAGYSIYNIGDTPVDHTVDINDFGLNNGLCSGYFLFD